MSEIGSEIGILSLDKGRPLVKHDYLKEDQDKARSWFTNKALRKEKNQAKLGQVRAVEKNIRTSPLFRSI